MDLYFGGSEIPGWATLLGDAGVEHMALSYVGLRRRNTLTKPWLIQEKYPAHVKVYLDSGAYSVNAAEEEKYTIAQVRDLAAGYMAFADANLGRVEMLSEFDALVLGREWIEAMREDYYDDLPEGKFLPIWHPEHGVDDLTALGARYGRVGVPQTALDGRNLAPTLNAMAASGVRLHGVAMTKPDALRAVRFDSVASTSWLSPSQYGDTIVWTGKELKRYPRRYKTQARKRHRTLFTSAGFDAAKIEADESTEVLRLSIWSWRQQMAHLGATPPTETAKSPEAETGAPGVDPQGLAVRKEVATPPRVRERSALPVMGLATTTTTGSDGCPVEEARITTPRASMRACDSCFLSAKCPAFEAGAGCAYDIPVVIRTKDQVKALQDSLIEMQTQRVMFMRMAEDLEGGYADPNLSGEVDRLQKMIKVATELEADTFSVRFEAKGSSDGGMGVISRLFGREAGAEARALPGGPVGSERAMAIIEADVAEVVGR